MEKSQGMTDALDVLSIANFGRSRTESLAGNICVFCGESATEFRDALSEKEYGISSICQQCQDEIFGGPDAEEEV